MEKLHQETKSQTTSRSESAAAESAVAWLEEHGDYLFSFALSRVRRTHIAEDLVQETLLAAMQSHDRFQQRSTIRTWLTSILRHKVLDHWRKQGRMSDDGGKVAFEMPLDEHALERFVDSQFTKGGIWRSNPGSWSRSSKPLELLESEEFREVLLKCLEKLPPRPAEAIDLVERSGMNLEQLSNLLGITATHAGVILHRARLALRECLEKNWFRRT